MTNDDRSPVGWNALWHSTIAPPPLKRSPLPTLDLQDAPT